MIRRCFIIFAFMLFCGGAVYVQAQADTLPDASGRSPRQRREEAMGIRELLAKQQSERDKKEHQEMLERGEEVLRITKQLEASFASSGSLSSQDMSRLASLERTVEKIRKGLGGSDDESDENIKPVEEEKPKDLAEGFKYLQTTTLRLVDELKKTTRFSISAAAIQTSNTVIKLVRFLRLRK